MIDETVNKLEKQYTVHEVKKIPLHGGQFQYIINLTTKPLYDAKQLRLWSNAELNKLIVDIYKTQ